MKLLLRQGIAPILVILGILLVATVGGAYYFRGPSPQTGTGSVQPVDPTKSGLATYPDYPLDLIPSTPISVKFLVEHRSALNGKVVSVQGTVINTLLGEAACSANPGSGPAPGACAQPRITLADTASDNRDKNYDLVILVDEEESAKDYPKEKAVIIKGTVSSSKTAVVLRKN